MRSLVLLATLAGCIAPARHPVPEKPPPTVPDTVTVAAVQCPSVLGDVDGNRRRLTALVRTAAREGAKFVVLPEAAVTGYLSQDLKRNWQLPGWPLAAAFTGVDPSRAAETVPGRSTRHFAKLADELDIYLTVPLVERSGEHYFNTVVLVSPDGELVAHYRKLTPWPYPEQSWATPGDLGPVTYDTEYGRVGLAICFDIHTTFRHYGDHDLWTLLYPIAWVDDSEPKQWFSERLPTRVKKAGVNLVGANWSVDSEQAWHGYGWSTIIAKDGDVLAQADALPGATILYADLGVSSKARGAASPR